MTKGKCGGEDPRSPRRPNPGSDMTWKKTLARIATIATGIGAMVGVAVIVGGVRSFRYGRAAEATYDVQPLAVVELSAAWDYLRSVEPRKFGNR